MKPYKVTIITPTWNMGKFIPDCIESVRSQTYANIEHIILDNVSNDNTVNVVDSYKDTYNCIFIRQPDIGQANAINKGFDMATGDIVCWLNADDYYASNKVIENVISMFECNPTIDIITGKGYYVDGNKRRLKAIKPPRLHLLKYCDEILQPATFWKRDGIRLKENYNYVFDWIFFLNCREQVVVFLFWMKNWPCIEKVEPIKQHWIMQRGN